MAPGNYHRALIGEQEGTYCGAETLSASWCRLYTPIENGLSNDLWYYGITLDSTARIEVWRTRYRYRLSKLHFRCRSSAQIAAKTRRWLHGGSRPETEVWRRTGRLLTEP